MKNVIKVITPGILITILCYLLQGGKNILDGIYIIFPIIYVLIGILYKKKEYIISLLLTSTLFLISVNIWFNMGTCIDLVIIYILISLISYKIRRLNK